jgi:hypothetical protein
MLEIHIHTEVHTADNKKYIMYMSDGRGTTRRRCVWYKPRSLERRANPRLHIITANTRHGVITPNGSKEA